MIDIISIIALITSVYAMLSQYGSAKEGLKDLLRDLQALLKRCKK